MNEWPSLWSVYVPMVLFLAFCIGYGINDRRIRRRNEREQLRKDFEKAFPGRDFDKFMRGNWQ
jgi:hypothetical protein